MNDERTSERADSDFDLVLASYLEALDSGEAPGRDRLLAEHPALASRLARHFADADRMERLAPPRSLRFTDPAAEAEAADQLAPGATLGAHRLEALLGRGGMGTVWRARHEALGKTVAVKVLASRFARDPSIVERFEREARALARLQHPNIVAVHDLGVQDGRLYFVMELVDGVDLRRLMTTGELTPAKALAIVQRVCDALAYAHDQGVVHRDVKPENVLVDRIGTVKVADFGLARVLRGDARVDALTRSDVVMGTWDYMAPEQRRSSAVDHRADIYAVGVVLFEMLTGEVPVGRFERPSAKAAVDARVDDVVLKALASEPERRYQRASEMGAAVSAIVTPPPGAAGLGALPAGAGADGAASLGADGRGDAAPRAGTGLAGDVAGERAPRHLEVVVPESGKVLGAGPATRLRIAVRQHQEIEVRGWGRPDVGVAVTGSAPTVETRPADPPAKRRLFKRSSPDDPAAPPWIELALPSATGTIYVPADLPVEIEAPHAELKVEGLVAPVRVLPGAGKLEVREHRGPLAAERLADGKLVVSGIATSALELRAQSGAVTVTGLALRDGSAEIRTHEGRVDVGLRTGECDLRYTLASTTGGVSDDLASETERTWSEGWRVAIDPLAHRFGATREESEPHGAEGQVGAGRATLAVTTFSGAIGLHRHGRLLRRLEAESALRSLFLALVCAAAIVWLALPPPTWLGPLFFLWRAAVSWSRTRRT